MENYKIKLYVPETERKVEMSIKATDWKSADEFATALASKMPLQEVYFGKDYKYITVPWCAYAEED